MFFLNPHLKSLQLKISRIMMRQIVPYKRIFEDLYSLQHIYRLQHYSYRDARNGRFRPPGDAELSPVNSGIWILTVVNCRWGFRWSPQLGERSKIRFEDFRGPWGLWIGREHHRVLLR